MIVFVILALAYAHIWFDYQRAPRLGKVYTDNRKLPFVSVMIPARNEQQNIANCLDGLLKQDYPDFEILVIDDGSEDKTFEIASEYAKKYPSIRVLKCPEKPSGWLGKSFALHYAVSQAKGDYFAMIDADVSMSPHIISRVMYYALENKIALVSLLPTLKNINFWENAVQPVMGFMIVLSHPMYKVNDPASSRVVANGQFLLFERNAYFKIGGHEAIKSELVEDVELARSTKNHNLPYALVLALDDMQTRMYESLYGIWRGWGKSIYPYIQENPVKLWLGLFSLFIVFMFPFFTFLRVGLNFLSVYSAYNYISFAMLKTLLYNSAVVLLIYIIAVLARGHMNQKRIYAIFFPIAFAILFALFLTRTYDAIFKKGVMWKGRIYQ